MKKYIIVALMLVGLAAVMAIPASAEEPTQFEDPVERGEYLANIAGCVGCHTPLNFETLEHDNSRPYAGGTPFDLGPLGIVFTKNLTPDEETGLGLWSDEEIKTAISTGISPDGLHLFPVMPYLIFNNMAEEDLSAIVAFLRSLEPITNEVPRVQILPPEALPQLPRRTDILSPDPADTEARAAYLFSSVMPCTDCHTPIDPETGAPMFELFLAGGQPFEGPWGILYGGNITPDEEFGIGSWPDEDIERVLRQGIRPDGRQVVLMPWEEYKALTEEDMEAVIYYLRNLLPAVDRQVPEVSLNDEWVTFVEIAEPESASNTNLIIAVGIVVVAIVLVAAFRMTNKSNAEE